MLEEREKIRDFRASRSSRDHLEPAKSNTERPRVQLHHFILEETGPPNDKGLDHA